MVEFNLNLLYQEPIKPTDAFGHLGELFEVLENYDKWLLSTINRDYVPEYYIDSIEYASIKTKIVQIIRGIPDEAIKEFDWKKLIGHFLLKAKYWVLKKLESKNTIDSTHDFSDIVTDLENSIVELSSEAPTIVSPSISIYLLLFHMEELIRVLNKLEDKTIEYESMAGRVAISKTPYIDKEKIINELGAQTINNDSIEILRIKKIDLLSDESKWDFKLANKTIKAKIADIEWLEKFHNREFKIQPQDGLKVTLRTKFTFLPNRESTSTSHEIIKIHEIVNPEEQAKTLF